MTSRDWVSLHRAQVLGVNGWVDGGLFSCRADAERDAERMAALYGAATRVIGEDPPRACPKCGLLFPESELEHHMACCGGGA